MYHVHLPRIHHASTMNVPSMPSAKRVHVHVPRLRLCMHVQAEPKKEKKQRTATAAEKSLAQQNKEVLADSGSQVSRLPEGRGEARAGVGRGRGEQWRRAEACSCPARGGRAGAGGEEAATGGRAPPPPRWARASSSTRAVRAGSSARAWARLRGAPRADSAPRLCLRQAKKRLSFLLGQSELFKHFGVKDVKPPLAPS